EKTGVGGMPGEMHVKMRHPAANELLGEKERVARALRGLETRAISRLMVRDESGGPNAVTTRKLLDRSHNSRRRPVADFGAQIRPVAVAKAHEWRVDRSDFQVYAEALQGQHLRIAERLRDDGVARIEIAKSHGLRLRIADCGLQIDVAQAETGFCLRCWKLGVER
ncbi:MAG TPA: hypothetical protein VGJ66_22210, partial [Pyrinomonadaceae bacterium]